MTDKRIDEPRLRISLEFLIAGDGRHFLNFWNSMTGDDLCVELKKGKLFKGRKEISIEKFLFDTKEKYVKSLKQIKL